MSDFSLAVIAAVVLVALSAFEIVYVRRLRRQGRDANVVVRNGRWFGFVLAALILIVLLVPGLHR